MKYNLVTFSKGNEAYIIAESLINDLQKILSMEIFKIAEFEGK